MIKKKIRKTEKEVKLPVKFNVGAKKYEPDLPAGSSGDGKKVKKREEKQIMWFLIIVIGFFVIFFGVVFSIQWVNHFEYAKMDFEIIDMNGLRFYKTSISRVNEGVIVGNFNLYLRTDPRENNIPISADLTSIQLNVSVTLEPRAAECDKAVMSQSQLGQFLGVLGVKNIEGGYTDVRAAEEFNISHITCDSASFSKTVIVVQTSKETSIVSGGYGNCIVLNIGECENLATIERFIIGVITQLNGARI